MTYKTLPNNLTDLSDTDQIKILLDWLEEVFKTLDVGVTESLTFDATTSGAVNSLELRDGIIIGFTTVP